MDLSKFRCVPVMKAHPKLPYIRLSGFYFFYFSSLGAFLPYWALYLQQIGLGVPEIGQIMAIQSATKVVAPNLWGWLADQTGRPLSVIRWAGFFSLAAFCLVFGASSYLALAVITVVFSFFWNATLPLFEALTLEHLHRDTSGYSRVRLWGSVGFITAVMLMGEALEGPLIIDCLPQIVAVLFLGLWLISLMVPPAGTASVAYAEHRSLRAILKRKEVVVFFLACICQQIAHGPYYIFFSVYLEQHGFSKSQTGQLWGLGVMSEILLFVFIHRLLARYSLRRILLVSLALSIVRWLMTAWSIDHMAAALTGQVLHAASFGSFHVAAIHCVHRYFKGTYHAQGQALYSSLSFGLGGSLGSLAGGELWDIVGPHWVYSAAAGFSLLGLLLAAGWVGKNREATGAAD